MEDMGVKINIPSCFIPNYILNDMILKGILDTPRMEFLEENDSDVQKNHQEFQEVSVSEVDLNQEELDKFSEIELARQGIILVKKWKIESNMSFFPQTRIKIEGDTKNYVWIRIEKVF